MIELAQAATRAVTGLELVRGLAPEKLSAKALVEPGQDLVDLAWATEERRPAGYRLDRIRAELIEQVGLVELAGSDRDPPAALVDDPAMAVAGDGELVVGAVAAALPVAAGPA